MICLTNLITFDSADAIQRARQILDQIPGKATGAYSHSQVIIMPSTSMNFEFSLKCNGVYAK